jgi:hypothetical protein
MSLTSAIKEALAKKHAAQHPDAKETKDSKKVKSGPPVITSKPPRKAAGRGR